MSQKDEYKKDFIVGVAYSIIQVFIFLSDAKGKLETCSILFHRRINKLSLLQKSKVNMILVFLILASGVS